MCSERYRKLNGFDSVDDDVDMDRQGYVRRSWLADIWCQYGNMMSFMNGEGDDFVFMESGGAKRIIC